MASCRLHIPDRVCNRTVQESPTVKQGGGGKTLTLGEVKSKINCQASSSLKDKVLSDFSRCSEANAFTSLGIV